MGGMLIYSQAAGFLISGQSVSGTGAGIVADTRNAPNYGAVQYASLTPSAVVKIQASMDSTGWVDIITYTASPTTAFVQLSGYYPYLRGVVNSAFGGGGATGSAYVYYAPGIK